MEKVLTESQIQQCIRDGYVKIEDAFPRILADEARDILWKDTGCNPNDPATWTQPVIRLGNYAQAPFQKAANTPILHAAFNQLVGEGNWRPLHSLGTFPVRFPSPNDPGDAGWHVDASFPGENPSDFFNWRINIHSKGRALLLLFLFSDVATLDAPTRIRTGSHLDTAHLLSPAGEAGMSFMELAQQLNLTDHRPEVLATGKAGTVYLCHPFLVHAAQPHHGNTPRFMAQPPLVTAHDFQLQRPEGNYSPVEIAIRLGTDNDTY